MIDSARLDEIEAANRHQRSWVPRADADLLLATAREAVALCDLERTRRLEEALRDAVAHLAGAASAYRTYACRKGGSPIDPFFTTRADDFDKAAARGREAAAALLTDATMQPDEQEAPK